VLYTYPTQQRTKEKKAPPLRRMRYAHPLLCKSSDSLLSALRKAYSRSIGWMKLPSQSNLKLKDVFPGMLISFIDNELIHSEALI
jgi:hypothetical protein